MRHLILIAQILLLGPIVIVADILTIVQHENSRKRKRDENSQGAI
jgi:hypothetical protein